MFRRARPSSPKVGRQSGTMPVLIQIQPWMILLTLLTQWISLLPKVPLGPGSRHLFAIPQTEQPHTHVKLSMYPDGGIARFRVYGLVSPIFPADLGAELDLAHVLSGGRVVRVSDQHFGTGSNLLLPGRGKWCVCLLQFCISFITRQGRTWEMAGKLSEVGRLDTLIGRLLNCETR